MSASQGILPATKPYHQMSLKEYTATAHSQSVPRWSILAIPPDTYTHTQNELIRFGREAVKALALLWGVTREGSKEEITARILRRVQFRSMLAEETEISLALRPRKELVAIATEAGIYHPWLNRKGLAGLLIRWREDSRNNARTQIAMANHERLVRRAARKSLRVPEENLRQYGLDASGCYEKTTLGMPLSRALRFAPEAVEAAKTLSASAFREWVLTHQALSGKLVFIQPGILGDHGDLFWREVQRAFAPEIPPLFHMSLKA